MSMRNLVMLFFGLALTCQAGPILTVAFTPMVVAGEPGAVISFSGTLTNNDPSNTEFINSDSFNLAGSLPLNDNPFPNNAPLSLGPGLPSTLFQFFTVAIPGGQALGLYAGTFTVLGGLDPNAQDNIGQGSFTVDVTPEPSTALLLGGAVLCWILRKSRFS